MERKTDQFVNTKTAYNLKTVKNINKQTKKILSDSLTRINH